MLWRVLLWAGRARRRPLASSTACAQQTGKPWPSSETLMALWMSPCSARKQVGFVGSLLLYVQPAAWFIQNHTHAGAEFPNWKRRRHAQAAIAATIQSLQHDSSHQITENDVLQITHGGMIRHTWAHPEIAVHVACWLSGEIGAAIRRLTVRYMEGRVYHAESHAVSQGLITSRPQNSAPLTADDIIHEGSPAAHNPCSSQLVSHQSLAAPAPLPKKRRRIFCATSSHVDGVSLGMAPASGSCTANVQLMYGRDAVIESFLSNTPDADLTSIQTQFQNQKMDCGLYSKTAWSSMKDCFQQQAAKKI